MVSQPTLHVDVILQSAEEISSLPSDDGSHPSNSIGWATVLECLTAVSPTSPLYSAEPWPENPWRPEKRYKDTLKNYPRNDHINISNWEDLAADRPLWRCRTHQATACFETDLLNEAEKRQRRKEERNQEQASLPHGSSCPHDIKISRS